MNRQLLEVLVSSSVLILALSAMRLVLRGKISPRLQYGLWLLAVVRLLVPVSIGESRASVMNYVPEQAMVQALEQTPAPVQRTQTPAAEPAAQPAAASAASDETPGSQTDAPDTMQAQQTQQAAKQNAAQAQPHPSILQICYMLWGAGSALALAFLLAQNLALSARLRKDRVRLDVPGCPVPVYRTEVLRSACLFGLFHPAIYLPPQALGEDGAPNRYVLLHELTHYKRRDQLWCALRLLLLAAYWFDPFVWLAAKLSKLDCELACDAAALKDMDDSARIAYGRTLLNQISGKSGVMQHTLCATTMSSGKRSLRARIRLIVKKPRMTAVTLSLVVGAVLLLAACTFTNSASKQEANTPGGDLPAMVRVDGVLYQLDMDTVGESDGARVEVLGTIKTQVGYSETPSEDDQANYPGVGRQYGMLDGQLVIKDKDGNWKYTLANLSKDEVSAAVIAYMAPGWADICAYQRCRQGMLVTAKRTNEDASLDAILMLAQKVDGEIQITQMETGRVDDDAGYGVFQTHMAGQTIVFGIADRRMRETGSAETTSVSFSSVTLRFSEGSTNTALSADPGETFVTGVYGDAEITSVRLNLGSSGDVAIFTDIPTAGEDGLATMTLAGNFADAAVEERSEPALSEKERQTIRQAVFDKFTTAQWDWENLTEDEIRSFSGADSYENGMVGNYPNYYGVFADFFVLTGRAPNENQTWTLSLPDERILALSIEEGGETMQRLYYSRNKGTLCGMRQEPLLTEDTPVGVGVMTDYADENFVVFHGYFGLFVYDLQRSEIRLALDLAAATGTTNIQGSYGNLVSVYQTPGDIMVMLTGYNDMQGGDTPYSYYLNATGRVRFAPTLPAGLRWAPAHEVTMTGDTIADLVYSDGTKTWNLFENWQFGEQSNAVFVPLTNDVAGELPGASQEEQRISSDDFYEMFWEIDRDSMQAYLDEHPEALWNGWTGIDINESGLNQSGTTIKTIFGEQVLAINYREKILLVHAEGEGYRGVLAVAKVPARLGLENAAQLGTIGQTVGEIAEETGGILAMSASRVPETDEGEGALTAGYAMSGGVGFGEHLDGSAEYGCCRAELANDNVLSIVPTTDPVGKDCRDAVETQPALIVDGAVQSLSGWTEQNPRACLGQSSRREMLLLVIEGHNLTEGIYGAALSECAQILTRHGAQQAVNLAGGTSAILWYDGQCVTRCSNSYHAEGRLLPNAFVYHARTD